MKIEKHLLDCKYIESPNTGGAITPTLLVWHYTASGSTKDADEKYFQKPASKASAHIVLERDGELTQCVPFNKKAWHAGVSTWRGKTDCNTFSIGIEIDNWGVLTKKEDGNYYSWTNEKISADKVLGAKNKIGNFAYWETYTQEQLKALREVSIAICKAYPTIKEIVGHEDISPRRKADPGPALYDFMTKINNEIFAPREGTTTKLATVTASKLNIREKGSENASVIKTVSKGAKVKVLYDGGDWSQIEYSGTVGWVFDQYLTY